MVAKVFISHASVDREWAGRIRGWLVADGHEVFLDQDPVGGLVVGEEWEQRLYERLRWADAVVCVVTTDYLKSVWCFAEIGIAKTTGSRLLPVRVTKGATHPLLTAIQQADAIADPVVARARLAASLRAVDAGGGLGWPDDRSPYPGLLAFDTDQHRVFFGRRREAAEIAERLRTPTARMGRSVLLVVGPSGCGKSSLVRAGVVPLIADEPYWLPLEPIVPGTDPLGALVRSLVVAGRRAGLDWLPSAVRNRLAEDGLGAVAEDILLATDTHTQRKLLVVIDQFEELLRRTTPDDRAQFIELLTPAVGGQVQVLATLRLEFLDQAVVDPALSPLAIRSYPLLPLRRDALRDVIEEPARVAGLGVDDDLVAELLADTDSGEALPLLAFALERLADGLHRGDVLSHQRYRETGGVRGALVGRADLALDEARNATGRSTDEIIAMLLRLVTVDERGVPTRDRVPRSELSVQATAAFDAFVAHRLLTTDQESDRIVISVAHEAFLQNWPPLQAAIAEQASALRARRAVESGAAEWDEDERSVNRLWEGGRLEAAMSDTGSRLRPMSKPRWRGWSPRLRRMVADRVEISSRALEFLEQSYRRDRFRRRRATVVLSTLLAAALVAAGVAIVQQRAAVQQQHTAVARQLMAQADKLLGVDPRSAIQLGLAADNIHPSDETRHWLVNSLSTTRYMAALDGPAEEVSRIAFSPDERLLAVVHDQGTLVLWNLADPAGPRRVGEPIRGVSPLSGLAFTSDSRTLLAGAGVDEGVIGVGKLAGVLELEFSDLQHPRVSRHAIPNVPEDTHLIFGPGAGLAVTTGAKQPFQLWDLADPGRLRQVGTLSPPGEVSESVAFSPNGHLLAVGRSGVIALWDVSVPAQPRRVGELGTERPAFPDRLAFSADGRTLAVGRWAEGVARWDISDPTRPHPIGTPIIDDSWGYDLVAFSLQESILITAPSTGNQVFLYDSTDAAEPRRIDTLIGQPSPATTLASSGGQIAVGGNDGRTTLWTSSLRAQLRLRTPPLVGSIDEVAGPCGIANIGDVVAVGGTNGNVDLWDISAQRAPTRTATWNTEHIDFMNDNRISCLALSPDGRTLATGSPDRTVSLWDISDRRHPRRLGQPLTGLDGIVRAIAFAPDGKRLAVGSDRNTLVWEIKTPSTPRRLGRGLYDENVKGLAFADGNRLLAFSLTGKELRLWDISDANAPKRIASVPVGAYASAAYSAAVDVLVTIADDETGQLWDVRDPAHPRRVGDTLRPNVSRFTAAFDSTGGLLAALGVDREGQILLWDVTDRDHPVQVGERVDTNSEAVYAAQFSSDSRRLVAGYDSGVTRIWDLGPLHDLRSRPVETACATVGSGLDEAGWGKYIQEVPYRRTCR
ncbi:TIR domain-containing protein [Nocardia sp. GCM10030253]|uniref:nSTAND1 domain-containing NTPase n=1 Tax=Nocardia sp. GCM10030253 TaxID=3273404 RepID=UPI00363464FC